MTNLPIAAMNPILLAALLLGVTGLICGLILAVASRIFAVHEDPRIETVTSYLPGINCGACGFAGCSDYARSIVLNGADISICRPGGQETVQRIAAFMGIKASEREREVALVLCNGDDSSAVHKADYNGIADCASAELAGGASKACRFGCLGLGSCARACPVKAIEITAGRIALIHPELCIGCGKCIKKCPRHLIRMVPESRSIHVLCMSKDRGNAVKKVCSVGCIGCTLCTRAVNQQGIRMEGALAVVDYSIPLDNDEVITKCPQHTIHRRSGRKVPS
jgi:Na+-translocating ferredoxin:NAD+ oxidoreductase subunit B